MKVTRPPCPIFQPGKLVLQSVSLCQQVFSASAIAALEVRVKDDKEKNEILVPVPHPEHIEDHFTASLTETENQDRNSRRGAGFSWYRGNRLNVLRHLSVWQICKMFYSEYWDPFSVCLSDLVDKMKTIETKLEE